MPEPLVLIVDDEPNIRSSLQLALEVEGFRVQTAGSGFDGLRILRERTVDLVLLDVVLPDVNGLELLRLLRREGNEVPAVVMSGHGTIEMALEATRMGAADFLEKPLSTEKILLTLRNVLRLDSLARENADLRQQVQRRHEMLGSSGALGALRERIARAAPTNARVLITGEHGTGKELVARALHESSRRRDAPFVKLNCAAIPGELIESELFGHEKGAFTGAQRARKGKFELADGGTLLLDEIGDMRLEAQAKLLRVLQEGELERVGGEHPIAVDVRVVAATNKNLEQEIREGRFREDLYYRLNVVPLRTPPLREHLEDVPELARSFVRQVCEENALPAVNLDEGALAALQAYSYPGNVRELRNLCERLVILNREREIGAAAVRATLPPPGEAAAGEAGLGYRPEVPLRDLLEAAERSYVLAALDHAGGKVATAAKALGLERSHLYKKLRALGIARDEG